jgi:hypothetical protein
MKKSTLLALVVLFAATSVLVANNLSRIRIFLSGAEEVPYVSTVAAGEFNADIVENGTKIVWTLEYEGLEGTVTQAHIHVGQRSVNGGISVWLCSNLTSPPTPTGVQPCLAPPARLTGTATAADVVGPAAQGVAAGEFAELLNAIRQGDAYANVHSTKFPGGEIRAQIKAHGGSGRADEGAR